MTSEIAQWKSLSALIFEVNRLNTLFMQNYMTCKVLLLCRTDIFELLEGANKNKIRQDSAIELNWYSDPRNPDISRLVTIANLRASLAFDTTTKVFDEFFPKKVFDKPLLKVLLESTRHTPRDFLQLLKYIQNCCTGPRVLRSNVISGLKNYSVEFLLPEILDELTGYCTAQESRDFFRLLALNRSRDFTSVQLLQRCEAEKIQLSKEKMQVILTALFECSAVGNVQQTGKKRYLTFRFRNRHSTFNIDEPIVLHRGLWRALNLPVDRNFPDEDS